jgi:ribonuclease M5
MGTDVKGLKAMSDAVAGGGKTPMRRVREVIIVEGRYDKNTVAQAIDATIVETSGFRIFSDKEKIALLRKLAEKRGLVVFTDSDRAGFFIRGRLRGMLGENVKHAYIPDVAGCERRKSSPSKEGKLGVEGMNPDTITRALERAGATFEVKHAEGSGAATSDYATAGTERPSATLAAITKADMYELGLTGCAGAAHNRRTLLKSLGLPERLTASAMLSAINILYTRDEFRAICRDQGIGVSGQ